MKTTAQLDMTFLVSCRYLLVVFAADMETMDVYVDGSKVETVVSGYTQHIM